ncbi:hypothetical protein COOONC_18078 [Cooperia oncophora]
MEGNNAPVQTLKEQNDNVSRSPSKEDAENNGGHTVGILNKST